MNEMLAQLYGTKEKIAAAQQAAEPQNDDEAFDNYVVEELEKTASAQGIDLSQLTEEELQEVYAEFRDELIKEASAGEGYDGEQGDDMTKEAMALGDLIGRTALHAFHDEAAQVQAATEMHEKLAGLSDEELLYALGEQRANNILNALLGDGEGFMKEASANLSAEDEEIDDLVSEIAAEMLDNAGYDVEAIAQALEG